MSKKLFDEEAAINLSQQLGSKATDKDVERIGRTLKFKKHGAIVKIWDKVQLLWEQLKNPETPWYKKTIIIGGLLYLIFPFDILADAVPALGFLDDVFVILFIVKQVLELTASVVIDKVKEKVDKKIKAEISQNLDKAFKNSLINIAISFSITVTGILFVILKPFGETVSYYIASFIFTGWIGYSVWRNVKWIKKGAPWIKSVCKERSVKKGIISEVKNQYHQLEVLENVKRKGSVFIHALDEIPCTEELYDYYLGFFKKRLLVIGGIVASYVLIVQFVLKPLLINQFGGITTFEIYVYPLTHILKTIAGIFK